MTSADARRDDRPPLEMRAMTAADRPAVLALLADAMARDAADPRFEALFAWKHEENAFGPSPGWLAVDGDRVAGVRVFMRWEFLLDGRPVRAVRAVDTATHPDHQGRGVFTRLTMHGLHEVRADGVDFVFNTPNDQSRPGYLKMGWEQVGRLPVLCRPRSPVSLVRMLRSRVAAERWSEESTAGEPAADLLGATADAEPAELAELLAALPGGAGLRTRLSGAFLRWRYGTQLLGYRAVVAQGGLRRGLALFRLRRRGNAREAALCEVLVPGDGAAARARLARTAVRAARADYTLALRGSAALSAGFVPLPGQGPVLTRRAAASDAPARLDAWHLTLGDVELF